LGRGGRWTARLALSQAAAITAGSHAMVDSIRSRQGGSEVRLVPLGVDLASYVPGKGDDTGVSQTVLFAGSLTPVKDPVSVVRAVARIASTVPDVRLSIVGDGPLRSGLERLARILGIGDRVAFAGRLPRSELVDHYRSAAVLVLTSLHEAQSMVACEAAACGTPVVGTPVGVIPELAAAGGALTSDVGDVAGLARAIESVLRDGEVRSSMGSAARSYAERVWGIDRTVEAWEALYQRVIDRPVPERS
jgi:glycosyltransferase involved in cell wall biosynthesis